MVQRETFNSRLRRLLNDRRMEPKELARLTGLSASYIRVLLSDVDRHPSIKTAEKIADALEVSVGELTGGDEEAQRLRELRLAAERFERATQANEEVRTVYADRTLRWNVEPPSLENTPHIPTPTVTPTYEFLREFWLLSRTKEPQRAAALEAEIVESLEGADQENE